jgi:hypothetical protein
MKDKRERTDNFLFFTFTILFIVMIFMQFDVTQRYKAKSSLFTFFGFNKTNSQPFEYPGMESKFNYILNLADQVYWFLDKKFEIVSHIRTTIRRYKFSQENNTILKNMTLPIIGPPVKFGQNYDPNLEETSPYTNNNPFNLTFTYATQQSYMQLGGYVFEYKKTDVLTEDGNSYDPIKKNAIWNKFLYFSTLKDISLTVIDFIVVNYELNYVCPVVIRFEHSKIGFGTMYIDIRVLYTNTYQNLMSFIRAGIEGFIVLLLLYYTYFIIHSIRLKAKWQHEKILQNMIKEEKRLRFSIYMRKIEKIRLGRERRDAIKEVKVNDESGSESNEVSPIQVNLNREVSESVGVLKRINVQPEQENLNTGNENKYGIEQQPEFKEYDSYRDIEISEKKIEEMKNKINMYLLYIRAVSKNISSIAQVTNLVISFFCFVLWIIFVFNLLKNHAIIDEIYDSWTFDMSSQAQNDLITSADALETYRNLLIINFLFLFFKLITILARYIKSINIFINTIKYAISDLLSFFVFFITLLIGFSIFTIFFYGRKLENFNEFIYAVQQNLSLTLGIVDENVFKTMVDHSEAITLIYILFILIFMSIIIKILLAIILHYYKISFLEYASKLRDIEKSIKLSKNGVGRSPIMGTLNTLAKMSVYFFKFLCCRLKDFKKVEETKKSDLLRLKTEFWLRRKSSVSVIKKSNLKVTSTLRSSKLRKSTAQLIEFDNVIGIKEEDQVITSKDRELYNLSYTQDYTFFLRDPYFDSVKDEWKLKDFYENKYKKVVMNAIFFVTFMVVFIFLVFTVGFIPWHNQIHLTLFSKLNDKYFNGFNQTDELSEVTSMQKAKNFIFNVFPKIFTEAESNNIITYAKKNSSKNNLTSIDEKNYNLLRYNTLLGNGYVVTLRYTEFDYTIEDQIRKYGSLDLNNLENENKTSFSIGKYKFDYSKQTTYNNLGGFNLTLNLNEFPNGNWPSAQEQDLIFNNFLTYAVVEFITDNLEYNFFTYTKILFKADYGSYKDLEYETKITKFYSDDTFLDFLAYIMYITFTVLLCYQWFTFILDLYRESKFYDQWYKEVIKKLSIKTQDLRNWNNPELLRKISYIIDWAKIIELTVLILCTYCFYLHSVAFVYEHYLASLYPNFYNSSSIVDIKNEIYVLLNYKREFQNIATIVIFLFSLRISIMINLGKYFSLLIRTIEDSKYNNITFIIIVILIEPAFIFYSFLCFGETNYFYSTLPWSILSNFNVMFGNVDFTQFSQNSGYGPLYFIVYMLIMNMLLLNIFQAVIYSSYTIVKEQIKNTNEKWSLRRVFLFCWYRKKSYMEAAKKSTTDEDLVYDIPKQLFETRMNIYTISAAKAYEELRKEVDQVKVIDDEINKNKEKLKNVESAFDSKKLGSVSYEENMYKDIEEKHVKCYRLNYLKKKLNIVEAIEQDILTIERFHEHLNEYENYFKFDNLKQQGKAKNEFMYEVSALFGKNIVELTQDVDEIRQIFEEIQKLDEETNK